VIQGLIRKIGSAFSFGETCALQAQLQRLKAANLCEPDWHWWDPCRFPVFFVW
jgi:hypothetical protein